MEEVAEGAPASVVSSFSESIAGRVFDPGVGDVGAAEGDRGFEVRVAEGEVAGELAFEIACSCFCTRDLTGELEAPDMSQRVECRESAKA